MCEYMDWGVLNIVGGGSEPPQKKAEELVVPWYEAYVDPSASVKAPGSVALCTLSAGTEGYLFVLELFAIQ